MRIAIALTVVGALFSSGCETTDSASAGQHDIFVKVDSTTSENDQDGSEAHIKIVIEREGEEPIRIEGDPASVEVQERLSFLEAEGKHVVVHKNHKMEAIGGSGPSVDLNFITSEGSEHIIIQKDGKTETIVIPGETDGKRIFIIKSDEHKKHADEHKKHEAAHKRIVVIAGDNEEEVRKQLKEHGIELELEFSEEELEEDKVEK